jgi:hypothetical protein
MRLRTSPVLVAADLEVFAALEMGGPWKGGSGVLVMASNLQALASLLS